MDNIPASNDSNNLGTPVLGSTPSVVSSPKRFSKKIIVSVFLLIVVLGLCFFFFLDIFLEQRRMLFKTFYLGFNSNAVIASPIDLNNPRIIQFGSAYVFRGKIIQITPQSDGVEITTDIPDLPPLAINKTTQVYKGQNVNGELVSFQNLATGQEIGVSVVYDLLEKRFFTIRVFIL